VAEPEILKLWKGAERYVLAQLSSITNAHNELCMLFYTGKGGLFVKKCLSQWGAPHAPHPLNPQLFTNVQLHVVSLRRNARHSSTTCIGVVNVRIETTLRLLRTNEPEHSAGILIPRFLFCFFFSIFWKGKHSDVWLSFLCCQWSDVEILTGKTVDDGFIVRFNGRRWYEQTRCQRCRIYWMRCVRTVQRRRLDTYGTGDTVSRRTANKKLTKLYWPSRKRSPKRLIVHSKKVKGHD